MARPRIDQVVEKNFVSASVDQQKQLLDRIAYPAKAAKDDSQWVAFFNQFRAMAVGGFFSRRRGWRICRIWVTARWRSGRAATRRFGRLLKSG